MTDIATDPLVRRHFPALAEAALVVGAVQIRNRATLAGNLCNASPGRRHGARRCWSTARPWSSPGPAASAGSRSTSSGSAPA